MVVSAAVELEAKTSGALVVGKGHNADEIDAHQWVRENVLVCRVRVVIARQFLCRGRERRKQTLVIAWWDRRTDSQRNWSKRTAARRWTAKRLRELDAVAG